MRLVSMSQYAEKGFALTSSKQVYSKHRIKCLYYRVYEPEVCITVLSSRPLSRRVFRRR